ncbi:hypothetical protein [Bdellovibrio bacteriovorus]|uniref:hypothetical protein n=1 Tax=Bdellovibrio bacteriovorus TaxID=959 RepID=UPI0035A6AE3C
MSKKALLLLLVCALASPLMAQAEDEIATAETQISEEATKPDYVSRLKEKYNLTDEQIQAMKDSKISESQFAVVGAMAKESGKTVEEILKMRTEDKMGWGKIAKELGLHPKMIGQSVSSMQRQDDVEAKKERKEAREARKEERKQKREDKKQARKEARSQKKNKDI